VELEPNGKVFTIHPPSIPHVAAQVGCWFTLAEWLAGWPVLFGAKAQW